MLRASLKKFALLSIVAALATIGLKLFAWWITGSVGLMSDALEGTVNLAGAMMMLAMVIVATRPPDDDHAYGYSKAEYFASGFEGMLIFGAAVGIAVVAVDRLISPQPLAHVGAGLVVSAIAAAVNFVVARRLFEAGRMHQSVALESDAHHLMTDVWTSAGVIAGVAAVSLTGWQRLDPLIALAVATHIVWTGVKLMRRSIHGLLDRALPAVDLERIHGVLAGYRTQGIDFHALRTRQAGTRKFISMHVLVPAEWSVSKGHEMAHCVEHDVRQVLPGATVLTHVEPLGAAESYRDIDLDP